MPSFPSPADGTEPDSNENKARVAVHSQSTQDADEMSADKASLEPCPFCGGEQPYVWIYRDKTVISALTPEWHVHCKSCNIQISATRKGEAISRWNTRPSGSAELREGLNWQPIETAPRDGTSILVCVTHNTCDHTWETVQWIDWARGAYIWPIYQQRIDIPFPPTHWMPLPPPPGEDQ